MCVCVIHHAVFGGWTPVTKQDVLGFISTSTHTISMYINRMYWGSSRHPHTQYLCIYTLEMFGGWTPVTTYWTSTHTMHELFGEWASITQQTMCRMCWGSSPHPHTYSGGSFQHSHTQCAEAVWKMNFDVQTEDVQDVLGVQLNINRHSMHGYMGNAKVVWKVNSDKHAKDVQDILGVHLDIHTHTMYWLLGIYTYVKHPYVLYAGFEGYPPTSKRTIRRVSLLCLYIR